MSAIGSILSNDGALGALNSIREASNTSSNLQSQLSSGKKVNTPADNPAGYITAQGFTSQLNGLNQALSNASQGVSLLQTAQGAISQQSSIVQKINSIAVQAANGTQTPAEAQSLQNVVGQLTSQINTIAGQTQFNNIGLLDGSFSGVSLQVGANNGQTISLSIRGTSASNIGENASQVDSAVYSGGSSGVIDTTGSGGAFSSASAVTIHGSNGTKKITLTGKTESAADIAQSVNSLTSSTNVQAQAKTSITFDTGSATNFSFSLGNGDTTSSGQTNKVDISATSKDGLVDAINSNTAKTGVTAKKDANNNVVLEQSQGKNISITGLTQGSLTEVDKSGTDTSNVIKYDTASSTAGVALIQGKVELQSDQGFSVDNGANIGVQQNSTLNTLSSIDVSTTAGAQKAINVVKYALQSLGAEGGQLGAAQQRLQANINNNNTISQNLSSARSVIQDANIPQVSQNLTQVQVREQAGIAALRSSSTLQQQYQRLLP